MQRAQTARLRMRSRLWSLGLLAAVACGAPGAGTSAASPGAGEPLILESNVESTVFFVDGRKVGVGKSLHVRVSGSGHTVGAEPPGYELKEMTINPPYDDRYAHKFTFMMGDKLEYAQSAPAPIATTTSTPDAVQPAAPPPAPFPPAATSPAVTAQTARSADPTTADCLNANERALAYRRSHKLRDARAQFLVCAAGTCPADVRNECSRRVVEVNAAIPTIVFEAKDAAGSDLSAVKVSMDGQPLADTLEGIPISLDPGAHQFVFETANNSPIQRSFVISEGQKGRREQVVFGSPTR
jgi:hypothetical protein